MQSVPPAPGTRPRANAPARPTPSTRPPTNGPSRPAHRRPRTARRASTGSQARLTEEETRGIARAARRSGGRRVDEDLSIDPPLRAAAEAALADATRAYVVPADAIPVACQRTRHARRVGASRRSGGCRRRPRTAIPRGGHRGRWRDRSTRRSDATGPALRDGSLARAAWLPDLEACLAIQPAVPPGWVAVTRDGGAIVTELGVVLGAPESVLERRSEAERLTGESAAAEAEVAKLRGIAVRLAGAAKEAADDFEIARNDESQAAGVRRAAEEAERLAARQHEAVVRESAWHDAQAERLTADLERARLAAAASDVSEAWTGVPDVTATPVDGEALAAWETRATELRARRDRLAEESGTREATRRDAENRRARAEASTVIAEERMARADRDASALGERERILVVERDGLRAEIATTAAAEAGAREALREVEAADAEDRDRLTAAERDTTAARERLRVADTTLRAADHAELEARLGLEALHEGVVVELAGLGELGVRGAGRRRRRAAGVGPHRGGA